MTSPAAHAIHDYLDRHQRKELLRFLTCGSVDDGKSTLIGRLLHDTKTIYEDQLAAVTRDSVKHGTTGQGQVDLALLTDGLKAEREQGITIDVAYRYFSTDKRKFIIADTPGHEQYTRNMATGASTCQLAIILIDARYGVVTQTKRHSYIVSLLGIRHIVVAVNKMDLVDYAQARFDQIRADYAAFAETLGFADVQFIPLSALKGDNVVEPSPRMGWYDGPPLLRHLETVPLGAASAAARLRFPVQYVIRPNLDFRGFAGTIASGTVRAGDEVMVLPSGKRTRVKSIVTYDGELPEASAPQAVTVTLADEVDVSRGDMLVHPQDPPYLAHQVEAMVVWMHQQPFAPGRSYWLKQATRLVSGEIAELRHAVDVNTLEHRPALRLNLNEVGHVVLTLSQAIAFDAYKTNRTTGAFIIIDRLTNNTVGAGMILGPREQTRAYRGPVTADEREVRLGQRGAVVWVDEAIAEHLERYLFDDGRLVVRLSAPDLAEEALAAAADALSRQAIICLIGAERGPTPALAAALGVRALLCPGRDLDDALLQLRQRGLVSGDEAIGGAGI